MAVRYLKRHGHDVLDNGFEVIPITPGTKHPNFDYSSETLPKITHKRLDRWLSNGHARDGIGIRTRFTPLLDIDSMWKPMVEKVMKRAQKVIGQAPVRIGQPPKVGLMFKSTAPFKKVTSKAFKDPNGNKCQVEFLGDGQQFVAYAIHPDTHKPYTWIIEDQNPVDVSWSNLEEVSQDQALEIVQYFEQACIKLDWERWKTKKKSTALTTRRDRDPDDIAGDVPIGISEEEVKGWVERLNNDDDVEYEGDDFDSDVPNYRNVIFAIWHETNGSEEGREIAWDWSEKSSKHEQEEGRFDKLWRSADPEDRAGGAVTFRYIVKLVLLQEARERTERREELLESVALCEDADDLKVIIGKISKIRFDEVDIERLAHAVKDAFKRITHNVMPIGTARKLIYHKPSSDELPAWVTPWVYIRHTGRFYNRKTGEEVEHKQFDASFSRYLGGASAVDYALNKAEIKTYYMQMYKPDDEEEFGFAGHQCINTFSERLMPEMPGKYTKGDRLAIRIVEEHVEHILPEKREASLLLSYLAYIVQMRQRPNWMVILQGVDGDGKSFFGTLMGAVLGSNNCRILDATQLEDKYTGWSVGQLFTFIEELRMQGHNRYDILNKIKPYITNEAINVHPKNVNPYTALNTTAYMAATNFGDALPLNDNDRRYLVLASAWQSGDRLRAFLKDNPGYFNSLFGTLQHSGAIRQWLNEYELHKDFNPKTRAPLTRAREKMIQLNKSEPQVALEQAIRDNDNPYINRDLIVSSELNKYLYETIEETLQTTSMSKLLSSFGYDNIPNRFRVKQGEDSKSSVWVRDRKLVKMRNFDQQRREVIRLINHKKKQEEL